MGERRNFSFCGEVYVIIGKIFCGHNGKNILECQWCSDLHFTSLSIKFSSYTRFVSTNITIWKI
jgi:hypothetical protein